MHICKKARKTVIKRLICLFVACLFVLTTGCTTPGSEEHTNPGYDTYKDIPGVTQADIDAIEKLLSENPTLVYGFPLSTEAFYNEDGSLDGFVTLLYARMSELFGFEFVPNICDWDELLDKIESKEIDFTAELAYNSDRQEKYYMTDPIVQRSIKIFSNRNNEDLDEIKRVRLPRIGFVKGSNVYMTVAASWDGPFSAVFIDGESEVMDQFLNNEIDEAVDGQQAVEMFEASEQGKYDVIFMDIQMPRMNGYEAAKAIRALDHPDAATIQIIAMTANAYQDDIANAIEAGMNSHLSKPVDIAKVMKLLGDVLGGKLNDDI